MAAFESSSKSLLQGVSQQTAKERLPGQVSSQENMLSDPVTLLRRRPGAAYAFNMAFPDATKDSLKAWFIDIAGAQVHIILNCADGAIVILDSDYAVLANLAGGAYLTSTSTQTIRAATVGDEFFLCNTAIKPVQGATSAALNPAYYGYYYVAAGAFSREFNVTLTTNAGSWTYTYTTPTGSGAGDAALSTPAYIANNLATSLNAGSGTHKVSATVTGAYVFLARTDTSVTSLAVNSSTGSAYVQVSKDCYTTVTGNLPALLPAAADGLIMRVGDVRTPQYYKYVAAQTAWLEAGAYNSPGSLTSMPVSITKIAGVWTLSTDPFEGRLAGDDTSNPNPRFVDYGITGISTYQGRLVMLSGAFVRLSASNKPRRFYRSTITSILDSDPIEVASSGNSAASYQYAVPFQKDLVLFSAEYQALIPSGNAAITPRTATVVQTSSHATDITCAPVQIGRTLMYASPLSEDFFGVLEMVPSQYTDSQYISLPATEHLPKYFGGRCRFSVSSGVSGMVLFAPSGDTRALVVHEYQWSGDQKIQSAWHHWTFPYDIAAAYFANERIVVLHAQNGVLVGCTLDPRAGLLTAQAESRPFLDMHVTSTIVANEVTPPTWLLALDPDALTKLKLAKVDGALAGDPVGFSVQEDDTLRTVRSHPTGPVAIGIPYLSSVSPTPPVVRDANEVAISTNKLTILRYIIGTANSGEYEVLVRDRNSIDPEQESIGTLYWSSLELEPGSARVAAESLAVVPCRTHADTTTLVISTQGTRELNITSLEHVLKYNQKIRRR